MGWGIAAMYAEDRRGTRFAGWVATVLLAASIAAAPCPARSEATPIPRTVLALYDGAREPALDRTRIYRYAEMVLNHLGFAVAYLDVRGRLPPPQEVSGYAAVLTWFSGPLDDRGAYLAWAQAAAPATRKLIVLGAVGGAFWTDDARAMDAILGRIGLVHGRRAVELTLGTGTLDDAPRLTRFERNRDPVVPPYEVVRAASGDVETWLRLSIPAHEGGGTAVAVGVSPRGGYAAAGFEIAEDLGHDRVRWLIDPFAFLGRILSPAPWPVPDVTTLSGRRLAFSHVEGDGLNDVVEMGGTEVLLARRFLSEIVEAYPDVPVTFALTPGDLDPTIGGNATPRGLVTEIWAAPNVEASVASYTRPYRWSFFDAYSRETEVAVAAAARPEAFRPGNDGRKEHGKGPDPAPWSVGAAGQYPRNYIARPFSLGEEIAGATAAARAILPEGKTLRLYQWTGDANPGEAALAAARIAGLLALNGGESRFDGDYPSVGHLVPLSRPVGAERQIYAVGADERPLAKAWRPITAALRGLDDTLARTEWPRRLKPWNLHYHLASLANPEALSLVRAHVAALRDAAVAPVQASLYAAMAEGFFTAAVTPLPDGGWRITNRGAIETLRLDALSGRVDLARSRGLLGQARHGSAIYLALDPAVEPADIVLERPAEAGERSVGLVESRWRLSRFRREPGAWSFAARGFGSGAFSFEDVPAGAYWVSAGVGEAAWSAIVRTDADGHLAFTVPRDGRDGLDVSVRRLRTEEAQGE
ncbi:hypothetical protein MKK68_16950 [Methylobacterium sp. E-016]|nr:hypothetical protein [Methylobacterium sp. E-016]